MMEEIPNILTCDPSNNNYDDNNTGNNYTPYNITHDFIYILKIIYNMKVPIDKENLFNWYENSNSKNRPYSRISINFINDVKNSMSVIKNFYIIAHYNSADLPMLKLFDELKPFYNIIKNVQRNKKRFS